MILDRFPVILRPPTVIRNTIIHTKKEFLEFVNKFNGKKNIFVNLYHYTKTGCCSSFYYFDTNKQKFICNKCKNVIQSLDLRSFVIDSVVFDLDPDKNTYPKRLFQWIKSKFMVYYMDKYELYLVKSGKGFHFYVRTNPMIKEDFKHGAKNAIRNFQIKVEKEFGPTDWITHGDTSQQIRVPGTYNPRSGLFCTTLSKEHLEMKFKELEELTTNQPSILIAPITSGKKLDLKKYDIKTSEEDYIHEGELIIDFEPSDDKISDFKKIFKVYHVNYDKLSLCVRTMLNNEFLDYRQRYLLINILKNLGLSELDCEKIISISLWSTPDLSNSDESKRFDWAKHCIQKERQIYYVYHKSYGIPGCKSGTNLGFRVIGLCEKCKIKKIMNFR